jgi:hypothetical protein
MTRTSEDFSNYGRDFVESSAQSLASLSNRAQAIATEATEYTRKSIEANGEFVEALFAARSLEDAFDVQANHFRRSYEAFVTETSRIGELYADLAKDAYKPFESLIVAAG